MTRHSAYGGSAEQHKYDGCRIEDDRGHAVWEPSLGQIKGETDENT